MKLGMWTPQVKSMFLKYTTTTIEDLKADQEEDEMLQGVDCESVTAGCPRDGDWVALGQGADTELSVRVCEGLSPCSISSSSLVGLLPGASTCHKTTGTRFLFPARPLLFTMP